MPAEATVYVVDDDVSHLRSISRLLRASGYHVVMYESAAEFLDALRAEMSGCVITDLMMPEIDGIALQEALRAADNPLPIVFLTGHGDIPTSVQAMRCGAEDFLTKHAPKEKVLAAVERALERNRQEQSRLSHLQALRLPFELLTEREREVLLLVMRGLLNKQIAAELSLHERTVKLHRTHITQKIGVHSVAELVNRYQAAQLDWGS